mgnify:CR=1 FL=1
MFFKKKRSFNLTKLKGLNKEQKAKINKIVSEINQKDSTQKMLSFDEIFKNGICKIGDTYSKTVRFFDINYLLANNEDKTTIFTNYCEFLNYFNEKIKVQLTFLNQKTTNSEILDKIHIKKQNDDINYLRDEYYQMLKNQLEKGNNGIVKLKYLTFSVDGQNYKKAKQTLERIELDVINNFKTMGVFAESLNGYERLELLHSILNENEDFCFDYKMVAETGLTTKDFVAPMCSKNNKDNLEIDKEICSTFYMQILVNEMEDRILADLTEIDKKLIVNIHLTPFEQLSAIKIAQKKKLEVLAQKTNQQQKAFANGYDMDILPIGLEESINETTSLLENLKSRNEHLFLATILVTTFGKNKNQLEDINKQIQGVVQKHSCSLKLLKYQQEQALNSSLPLGKNLIKINRSLITSSTAIFVPFTTEELMIESKESLYYGLNALSNNIILADRKELKNPNGLVLGTPGSGKSFLAKREISNIMLTTNDDILISDPENEFSPLVKAFGGQVVNISPNSKDYINIMDINLNYSDDDSPLSLKSDFLLAFFEQIYSSKQGLSPIEKSIIDRCVKLVYQKYISEPKEENMPVLIDLYNLIKAQNEVEAKNLSVALELYVTGNFNYFNNRTNVNLDNRLVSFNIKELGSSLKKVGMLVVQDVIWNKITKNRNLKIATWTYMDEIHLQLKEKQTANYTIENWKRQRKYGGIPTGLTQNVKDFLASPEIASIFENSDFICMLNQGGGDREILANYLNISPTQLSYITDSQVGSGLLKYGGILIPFMDKFPKDTNLYKLMTTKPNEIIK